MIIPATTAAPAGTAAGNRSADHAGLAANFDAFLRLLTTQLRHQDPLSPLDAQAFTAQLVQFTAVEQAIKTNESLGRLTDLVRAGQIAGAVAYLGAEVEAAGNAVRLGPAGHVGLDYHVPGGVAAVTITVTDAAGRIVYGAAGATAAGPHRFTWDGREASGQRAPEGLYRVDVAAVAADGQTVPVATTVRGTVDGVDINGDRVTLAVDGVVVPLAAVRGVRRPGES